MYLELTFKNKGKVIDRKTIPIVSVKEYTIHNIESTRKVLVATEESGREHELLLSGMKIEDNFIDGYIVYKLIRE